MSDAKAIKRYQAGVERALGLFDASNEWADYIAFLSRLLKALQASPPGAEVPSRSLLARYLAQCLRPSLPSGVHQKALEAYGLIFTTLGEEGLASNLPVYFPGLAPTLTFAALNTRPWLLSLFDDHISKLPSKALRPALKAILLSLLPGIEEENSEDFDKTLATINRFRSNFVEDGIEDVFWQSLFLAGITSINRRMGVLMYLVRHLPKLDLSPQSDEKELSVVVTPEPGLLMRCFSACLQDEQSLVQRGFLDLLLSHLPLHSSIIQRIASDRDSGILVSAALSIVLKRDMSLNKRLWAWFLGLDEKAVSPDSRRGSAHDLVNGNSNHVEQSRGSPRHLSTYFDRHGKAKVIQTLISMMNKNVVQPGRRARPFRITTSLLDRGTIGAPVLDVVLELLIQNLMDYQKVAPSQDAFDEVFRSANILIDSVEPFVLTRLLLRMFQSRQILVFEFMITNFALDDDDFRHYHISILISVVCRGIALNSELQEQSKSESPGEKLGMERLGRILNSLVTMLPVQVERVGHESSPATVPADWMAHISQLYGTAPGTGLDFPVLRTMADGHSLALVSQSLKAQLRSYTSSSLLTATIAAFNKLYTRVSSYSTAVTDVSELMDEVCDWCLSPPSNDGEIFNMARNIVSIIISVLSQTSESSNSSHDRIIIIVAGLVRRLWYLLSPTSPQFHVESVEALWTLRGLVSTTKAADSTILSVITSGDPDAPAFSSLDRLGVFWTHSSQWRVKQGAAVSGAPTDSSPQNGLLSKLALYAIDAASTEIDDHHKAWLASLPSLSFMYEIVFEQHGTGSAELSNDYNFLQRVSILVAASRSSPALWAEFTNTTQHCESVLGSMQQIVQSHERDDDFFLSALSVVRSISLESPASISDDLLDAIVACLRDISTNGKIQVAILDTLQPLLTPQRGRQMPQNLLATLTNGISATAADEAIEKWVTGLCNALPLYKETVVFPNLLKLTEAFCLRIQQHFNVMQALYSMAPEDSVAIDKSTSRIASNPEKPIFNLMAGLEYILARAHGLITDAVRPRSAQGQETQDTPAPRSVMNNRLTVVLCMQDAIKVCGSIWCWRPTVVGNTATAETKSFVYLSSRLRNRSRRMLEHLTDAEPQECLETLIGLWVDAVKANNRPQAVMNLLQTLEAARPKFMMPAIFNAIYSRTNPQALDEDQKSTLSIDLTSLELLAFLIDYVEALEDDLLEEIWSNCTSFLRDVLANPMPQRQLLLRLIEFASSLCQKMDNTTFGEQNRMRRELSDLCVRLFIALFTIKPIGFDSSTTKQADLGISGAQVALQRFSSGEGVAILCQILPQINSFLSESDRITSIFSSIHANIIGPVIKARDFPGNVTPDIIQLLLILSKAPNTNKIWRKDMLDIFNSHSFFNQHSGKVNHSWLPVIKQLLVIDRSIVTDQLTRLAPPTTAGLVFGVGASAARAEADKQTKNTFRRMSIMLLAAEYDSLLPVMSQLIAKIEELLKATPSSSPSSATRSELYMVLRAMCLCFSSANLAPLWPSIDSELHLLFDDISKQIDNTLSTMAHLQGAKLLDLLLLLRPEEFQLHAWLFVTDTIDAIYPPVDVEPIASADKLRIRPTSNIELSSAGDQGLRKPWLCDEHTRKTTDQKNLLGSFFGQLSIRAFEDTYGLDTVDLNACRGDLLLDLFYDGDSA